MARDDLVQTEGKITDVRGGGVYSVTLDRGGIVSAKVCGKMRRFKIRILVGDRVTVALSPYDTSHGLITLRHK